MGKLWREKPYPQHTLETTRRNYECSLWVSLCKGVLTHLSAWQEFTWSLVLSRCYGLGCHRYHLGYNPMYNRRETGIIVLSSRHEWHSKPELGQNQTRWQSSGQKDDWKGLVLRLPDPLFTSSRKSVGRKCWSSSSTIWALDCACCGCLPGSTFPDLLFSPHDRLCRASQRSSRNLHVMEPWANFIGQRLWLLGHHLLLISILILSHWLQYFLFGCCCPANSLSME